MALDLGLIADFQSRLLSPLELGLYSKGAFGNYLRSYIITCKVEGKSQGTLDHYLRRVGDFSLFVQQYKPNATPQDITSDDARLYMLHLQQRGVKPITSGAHFRALRTFFNRLVSDGNLKVSPLEHLKPPKQTHPVRTPFSIADIQHILSHCSGQKFLEIRNRAMVLILLDTGLRLDEFSRVQLSDINVEYSTIKVMGKGGKGRVVKFGVGAARALYTYIDFRGQKWHDTRPCLWVSEEGRPMTRAGISTTIRKLTKLAGVKDAKYGAHTFRHTFATWCLYNGAPPEFVQELLGHASPVMTRHYTQTANSMVALENHKKFSPVDRLGLK